MNPFLDSSVSPPEFQDQRNPGSEKPVAESKDTPQRTLSPRIRLLAATAALALVVPLAIAVMLEPDGRGHGTHQQLGFPPCTLVALCGVRCPTCGMTTAWSNVVRGRFFAAAKANVGGVLLALAAIGSTIGFFATAAYGRRPKWFPGMNGFAWGGTVIAAITLLDWVIRLLLV